MPFIKNADFHDRLRSRQPLLGSFIKTPGVHAIEIMGNVGMDFVVIDAEHSPWDRSSIDLAVLAAMSQCVPALVRVASKSDILTALDCGAAGVIVPHVSTPDYARDIVAACRYRSGSRGFTNSSRAGRYGALGLAEHIEAGDRNTSIIAMLEDPQALEHADEIAKVDGIDAFFLGRGDLTVALGETSANAELVRNAIAFFVGAVKAENKTLCAFVGKSSEIPALQALGVSTFIVSSDQNLMRQAATAELAQFKAFENKSQNFLQKG